MARRRTQPARYASGVALLLAIGLVASACSTVRPTVAEWEPTWESITAAIPPQEVVGEAPPRALCNQVLASLREGQADLFPTPDIAIDDTVKDWVTIAEDAFFECPPDNDEIGSFSDAYAEMLRLEREVELVLVMDRPK
ncbi:MAG: hypothetical protein M3094_10495 [Actinomycetia bacterium]|nr:hypothetical protein [Actinomycetes bacterium]